MQNRGELEPAYFANLLEAVHVLESTMWRGEPFKLVRSVILPADEISSVAFFAEENNLPSHYEGEDEINSHFRSKWAHLGLDSRKSGADIMERARRALVSGQNVFELPIVNHSQRPVRIFDTVFHLFSVPEKAVIHGEELEKIVGNREGFPVYIQGEEGKDYRIMYETLPSGENMASAIYLRIDQERFWLPPSDVPIELPRKGNFTKMREILFQYAFKRTDDPEYSMPRNGLWIGKAPHVAIHPNLYLVLDHFAFAEIDGEFVKVGMQTHSPLLEGGRTNHYPHVEMKGKAEWAKVTVVRNSVLAKAG